MNPRLNVALAAVLMVSGAARAQVLPIQSRQSATVVVLGLGKTGPVQNGVSQYDYVNHGRVGQVNYQNYVTETSRDIQFADNATASGYTAYATSTSTVALSYTNTSKTKAVDVTLSSEILPAGFGFYIENPDSNPTYSGSSGLSGDLNKAIPAPDGEFSLLRQSLAGGTHEAQTGGAPFNYTSPYGVGEVSFNFDILSNGVSVADYGGSLLLTSTGAALTLNPKARGLANFGAVTTSDANGLLAYGWDATPVSANLGTLAPGATNTFTYITTVSAYSEAVDDQSPDALLAYAGIGDPIRRTAGTGTDPNFPLIDLAPPTFDPDTGVLNVFVVNAAEPYGATLPVTDIDMDVPEPRNWALMLVGLGLVGRALRGRHPGAAAPGTSGIAPPIARRS
jgi:hypothetical protein